MGLNPFFTFYIHTMLNVDANENVKCEHTFTLLIFEQSYWYYK